jgi:hypothetical protein
MTSLCEFCERTGRRVIANRRVEPKMAEALREGGAHTLRCDVRPVRFDESIRTVIRDGLRSQGVSPCSDVESHNGAFFFAERDLTRVGKTRRIG